MLLGSRCAVDVQSVHPEAAVDAHDEVDGSLVARRVLEPERRDAWHLRRVDQFVRSVVARIRGRVG